MQVIINGEERNLTQGITVAGLLVQLGIIEGRVAVEVNRDIVPKAQYGTHQLNEADRIEIVHFVGGG